LGFGRKDVNGKTKISLNHDVLLTSAGADEYFDHTATISLVKEIASLLSIHSIWKTKRKECIGAVW